MAISSESSAESARRDSDVPEPVKGPPGNVVTGLIKAIRASFGQSGGMPRPPVPEPDPAAVEAAVRGLAALGIRPAPTPVSG